MSTSIVMLQVKFLSQMVILREDLVIQLFSLKMVVALLVALVFSFFLFENHQIRDQEGRVKSIKVS